MSEWRTLVEEICKHLNHPGFGQVADAIFVVHPDRRGLHPIHPTITNAPDGILS